MREIHRGDAEFTRRTQRTPNPDMLIGPSTVCTFGDRARVIHDAGIAVVDGMIKAVGPYAPLRKKYPALRRYNVPGSVWIPGLICAHHHFYSTFARGLSPIKPPRNFLEVLKYMWWRLDRNLTLEDVYYSALIPLIECVRTGTTTVIDHHASAHAVRGSLGRIADAVRAAGIRANLCYEVSDRDGPEISSEGIAENAGFLSSIERQSRILQSRSKFAI